jgi:hypothetical protein
MAGFGERAVTAAAARAREALPPAVVDEVRRSVRGLLERAPAYAAAGDEAKQQLARGLVDLGLVAAGLMEEERKSEERLRARGALATAQAAGDQLSMRATQAAAGTLTRLRDAIDFPNYVGSLITGVFQAILNSSAQQLGSLSDLVQSVGVSAEDYEASVEDSEVARWLVAKFPRLLRSADGSSVEAAAGADLSEHATELQAALGAAGDVTDPDALMEMGRKKMAADKQSVLATMMQMGLQRIVVDEGRIHASMDLRVDAASASHEARAERDDWRVNAGASGQFGNGMWGASASASTSIGQVKTDAQLTSEQIGASAGLRSSVELAFRTDQVPLDKVASRTARARLENAAHPVGEAGPTSVPPAAPANFAAPSLDVPAQGKPAAPQAPAVPPVTGRRSDPGHGAPGGGSAAQPQQSGSAPGGPSPPPAVGPPASAPAAPPAQTSSPPAQPRPS